MNSYSRRTWLLGSALALGVVAGPAMAQDAAPQAEHYGVEEVIVTAQRRTQNLQQAPVAVTALSPETMAQRNVTNTADLMTVTPGLQVSTQTSGTSNGSATFFLRGMGQQRAGNGSEPAVGIYVDDIYYPSLSGTLFNIVDVAQVEVLRGPQGTLFGRNTIGGAIRYTTARPSFELEGSVTATYGSYDRADIVGVINVPFSDRAAIRLTAGHLQRDGYVKSANGDPDAGATETTLVRAQLRFDPTDDLTIDLGGQVSKDSLDGFPYALPDPIAPRPNTTPFTYNQSAVGIALPYDNRFQSQCGFCQPGSDLGEYNRNRIANLYGVVTWDISDNLTLKSLTGWTKVRSFGTLDYDGSIRSISHGYQSTLNRAFSQEIQLNADLLDGRLNVVAGGFYYEDRYVVANDLITEFVLLGVPSPAFHIYRDTKNLAGFADATFDVTDKLTILGGIRISRDKKDARADSNARVPVSSNEDTFSSTTGRIGLKYQWTDTVMTYATVSEGFKAGGFNWISNARRFFAFEPETSRSYELGARLELFDHRLRLNPTVFYVDWTDIQLQSVEFTPQGNIVRLDNAGKAHTSGLEVEFEFAATENLTIFGNLATLDAEYDSLGTATGITLNSRFQRAPELTYAIGATYRQEIYNGFEIAGTINYNWQDKQASTPTDTDNRLLPSYGVLSVRLDLTDPDDRWTLSAFATNLTDEVYYVGGVGYNYNIGAARQDLGRPQEFGVSLKARF